MSDASPNRLPPAIEASYKAYLQAENIAARAKMLAQLKALILAIQSLPAAQKRDWINDYLVRLLDEGEDLPLRAPLFEAVFLPELLERHHNGEVSASRWLAQLQQRHSNFSCWHRLQIPVPETLLKEALARDPDDSLARSQLILIQASYLEYTLHEIPTGVLYDMNGASAEQCDDLLNQFDEFLHLLNEEQKMQYAPLIQKAHFHYRAYSCYLRQAVKNGYADYLAQQGSAPNL